MGSTSREASSEELERMYQSAGRLNYGLKPVPGAGVAELDRRRLRDYLIRVLGASAPDDGDASEWETLLHNLRFATETSAGLVATVDGMLLFGTRPRRYLPQSGIRAICYPTLEPDYATRSDRDLHGPIVPLVGIDGYLLDPSLVDKAWDFVRLNTTPTAHLDGMRRVDRWPFPEQVVRECVANALAHRDYSIRGTVVPGMIAHDGTEPEFVAEEHRLTVRLRDDPEQIPR